MRGRGRGRGPARGGGVAAPPRRPAARTRRGDFYEAEEGADPRARRAEASAAPDAAAGLEELPDDFDDEEIDEDAAFTEADKARWGDLDEYGGGGGGGGSGSDGDGDEDEEIEWEDGEGDMLAHLDDAADAPRGAKRGAAAADVDEFLGGSDDELDDDDDDDEDAAGADGDGDAARRHAAMLHAAGVGAATRKRKLAKAVLTEAYPESEFNANPAGGAAGDALAGGGLSVDELASGLGGGAAAGALRAKLRRLERAPSAAPLAAPLAAPARARLERGAAYAAAQEHVTRWQPLVKANREAATLSFPAPRDAVPRAADTTAALVAAFTPESELERQVAALLDAGGAASAAAVREAEALALNAGTVEEAKERQARLAKMRSLLFFHEAKARRLKAIKSKGFHRHEAARLRALARKLGDTGGGGDADDAAKAEEAAELARVTERFGLKHRNTSRWARRAIAKGIAHLPGTREALQEQIRLGQTLRRKANAAPGSRADRGEGDDGDGVDASDDDESDDGSDGEGDDAGAGAARRRAAAEARARAAALDVLAGGADGGAPPQKGRGLQALPFMVKAQAKQKAAAQAAAQALLAELDGSGDAFAGAEDWGAEAGGDAAAGGPARGRRTFAGAGGEEAAARAAAEEDWDAEAADGSDSEAAEARIERAEAAAARRGGAKAKQQAQQQPGGAKAKLRAGQGAAGAAAANAANVTAAAEARGGGGAAAASGLDAARAAAASHAFAFEPAAAGADGGTDLSAPGAAAAQKPLGSKERRKERRREAQAGGAAAAPAAVTIAGAAAAPPPRTAAEAAAAAAAAAAEGAAAAAEAADPDALIGGVTARQRALIAAAFAGDDVAAEFAAAKASEVEAELPKAEVASQLPGWGAWAGEQKEPRWLRDQRKAAEAARAAAAAKRQDAGKKHVIISEKYDHKAAAFTAQTLPYPFTSRDAFEGAMRVPMGRETNTDAAFRDMTRPKVLKQPGTIIAPIKFSRAPPGGKLDKPKRR